MDKRRLRKHRAHKCALSVCRKQRAYFETTISGALALARAERLVGHEAAQFRAQEACRMKRYAATERCRQARVTMHLGVRHVSTVGNLPQVGVPFITSRLTNDVQRIARWEAVLSAAAPHAERFESAGIQPGFLDRLAGELAAFRSAKAAIAQAGLQYTEATATLDQTFADADIAIAILEGFLATSDDAPVGVLDSLRRAKFIGPRAKKGGHSVQNASTLPRAAEPRIEMDGRRRRWVPRTLVPFAPEAAAQPAARGDAEGAGVTPLEIRRSISPRAA